MKLDTTPTPAQIARARKHAGLTQREAGALLYTSARVWRQWESGDRRMHVVFWELFRIKAAEKTPSGERLLASYASAGAGR